VTIFAHWKKFQSPTENLKNNGILITFQVKNSFYEKARMSVLLRKCLKSKRKTKKHTKQYSFLGESIRNCLPSIVPKCAHKKSLWPLEHISHVSHVGNALIVPFSPYLIWAAHLEKKLGFPQVEMPLPNLKRERHLPSRKRKPWGIHKELFTYHQRTGKQSYQKH
jgi:hypothetical protein